MTHHTASRQSPDLEIRVKPSDSEVIRLLEQARQQYEAVMQLADLADLPDPMVVVSETRPAYSWDNPIGYVVTEWSYGNVV